MFRLFLTSIPQNDMNQQNLSQKGAVFVSDEKKAVAERIVHALESLGDNKKEYFLGFADGVVAHKEDPANKTPDGSK